MIASDPMSASNGLIGDPVVTPVEVVVDHSVRSHCKLPYPGHKKGCPNFGKKKICPPMAPVIEKVLDLGSPVYLLAIPFNLAAHVEKMGALHPDWTMRQRANLLYWQGSVKKKLRETAAYEAIAKRLVVVGCPEACGVDMTATCAKAGIVLEWPPRNTVWKAVLLGTRSSENQFSNKNRCPLSDPGALDIE